MTEKPMRFHEVFDALAEANTVQEVDAIERRLKADPSAIRERDWPYFRGAIEAARSHVSEVPKE